MFRECLGRGCREARVPPERQQGGQFFHALRLRPVSLSPVRQFDVDHMQAGEQPAVIAALARAFYDDPLFGFFVPNLLTQMKSLIAFMSSGCRCSISLGGYQSGHSCL